MGGGQQGIDRLGFGLAFLRESKGEGVLHAMREAGLPRGFSPLRSEEIERGAGEHQAASHELVAGAGLATGGLERCFYFIFHAFVL